MMNCFQELKHHRLSSSGKKEYTVKLREHGGRMKKEKSVGGKLPRTGKMRSSIIIFLVLGEAFNLIFIEFSNCSYLQR